ncbi:hypothetical protein HYH02_009092 [Chlamydomonas schloesseri]|uniref:EF-hand domain-containing protein n=1 Tax=Chlamydomonas schloesseri TaxID=2026947 RepID=A0A835WB47_9CHLO|nr:hypothetical protein HYH02_009092 [Chlamydomonas schloesseri]|eukprot:KAG2444153.1 hypothetical protein HYH02_009092 [Chlamydomonas schloesseri]
MLQLPKLTAGFKIIRQAYAHSVAVAGEGKVTYGLFRKACGERMSLEAESDTLRELWNNLPAVGDKVPVTHADAIIMYMVIYLLDGITKRRTITNPDARKCLQLVEQSFMFFDSTADGCIERKELAYALKSGTKVWGRNTSKTLADHLFEQLSWTKEGRITFEEFLVGMERIVMDMSDEDDDLEDGEEDGVSIDGDGGEGDEKKSNSFENRNSAFLKWQQQGSGSCDMDDADPTAGSGKALAGGAATAAHASAAAVGTVASVGTGGGRSNCPSPAPTILNRQGSMPGQTCNDPTALDQPAAFTASALASPFPQHMQSLRQSTGGNGGNGGGGGGGCSARASCNGLAAMPSALSAATASNIFLSMSPSMDLGSPSGTAAGAAGAAGRRRDSTHLLAEQLGADGGGGGAASPLPSHNGFFSAPLQESQQQSGAPGATATGLALDWQYCFADARTPALKGPCAAAAVGMRPESARRSSTGTLTTPPPPPPPAALTVRSSMNGRRSATGMLGSPRPATVVPTGALTASAAPSPVGSRLSIAGGPTSPAEVVVAQQASTADAHDDVIPFCEFTVGGLVPVE